MPMLLSKAMKRRSTTPVSKGLVTKFTIVAIAVVMVVAAPLSMMPRANADRFDDQINALQQQINQYQAEAGKLRAQADTLQTKVNALNNEKAQIQARIDLNQVQYDQLLSQIVQTK
jgi:peptidoglycan hydrolase CwlO-like protein